MQTLIVTYTVKEGQRNDFLAIIRELGIGESSRAEDGCLQYEYCLGADENTIVLIEKWHDEAARAAHGATSHFGRLQAIKNMYVRSTTIQVLDTLEL